MELSSLLRLTSCILLIALQFSVMKGDEYGSFHNSHPPFYYIRSQFSCHQNTEILWDSIVLEVHPGAIEGCGIVLSNTQAPTLWSDIDGCLNQYTGDFIEGCQFDDEFGLTYQINTTRLQSNRNITFPCIESMSIPEIVAVHLMYSCKENSSSLVHPEDDIMTLSPRLPPMPPHPVANSTTSLSPVKPEPTMVTDSTNSYTPGHGHIVVTDSSTTADTTSAVENTKSNQDKKSVHECNESSSRSLIYNELTVIISSSVAAIAVLLLVLVIVILIVKRRKLKLQTDLQSESLFTSRRFSTVSQLSEVSVTGGHRLSHTP